MPDGNIDVLMQIISKGQPLPAESHTQFATSKTTDPLRTGFSTGPFCELQEFNFSVGAVSDTELVLRSDASAFEKAIAKKAYETHKAAQHKMGNRTNLAGIDIQPVEFTRIFDTASIQLFQALVNCDTLDSISIVKRKAAGTNQSGEIYLRLDFSKVLLTDLDWKDSQHVVEETATFIYRQLTISYRPQNADGSLGSVIPMSWTMKT